MLLALRLNHPEQGGRRTPMRSGIFLLFRWGDPNEGGPRAFFSAKIAFEDELAPGQETTATATPLVPAGWIGLKEGDRIGVFDGPTRIGSATVLTTIADS
jgi:hypothetical protein